MKWKMLGIVVLVVGLISMQNVEAKTIVRGDNCNDYFDTETGTGTITLGKFLDYVRYNGECTDIKTIPSLKNLNRFVKVYLEKDLDYEIEFDDFNYTCAKKIKIKSEVEGNIPFKINGVEYVSPYFEVGEELEIEDVCFDNLFNYNFTFGFSSTTVQLQDADSENLEDTCIKEYDPNTNYGADTNIFIGDTDLLLNDSISYIKFNISSIPSNKNITFASLNLFENGEVIEGTETITVLQLNNQTWVEEDITWLSNNMTNNLGSVINTTTTSHIDGQTNIWVSFNVTSGVLSDYQSNNKNTSFYINSSSGGGEPDWIRFTSKETATTSQRPYLNITYGTYEDPHWYTNQSSIPTSYSLTTYSEFNMTWNISGDEISTVFIESNYSGTSTNYTMTNNTYGGDIYNYSVILPAGNYYWKSYANDTDDEWNSTDTWIFTINTATPTIYNFELNDTYISINNTILLTVNASQNANITAQIQTSGGTKNITDFTYSSGNYTKNIDKTILGESQSNSTTINITYIFTDGSNYTMTRNSSTLNFSYALADLSVSNNPTSVVTPGTYMNIYADYNTTEGDDIELNCSFTIGVAGYDMSYSSTNGRHESSINTAGWASFVYTYSVTCSNSSYQTKTGSGTFTIQAGGGGTGPGNGGGGGAPPPLAAALGEYCDQNMPCVSGLFCQNNVCIEAEPVVELCGNNVCDLGETFINCPQDCPSQSAWAARWQFIIIAGGMAYSLIARPKAIKKKKRRKR